MKKLLAILLAAMMILGGTSVLAESGELYNLLGWGIGGDTQGPVGGWVGDLWAEKGFALEAISSSNSAEQMQTMLAGGDLPYVIRFGNWEDFELAMEAGYLVNLDEHIDKLPNTVAYAADALQYTRDFHSIDGNLYGIPDNVGPNEFGTDAGCYAFNVRWDIYAKAGYPKAEKFEDVIDVFKAMKEVYPKTEEGLETYAINMFAEWDGTNFAFAKAALCCLGYAEAGPAWFIDYFIPTGEISSIFEDDSAYLRAMKFLYELNQAGLVDPDAMTQQYTTSQSKIANGQYLACWWGGYQSAFDTLEKQNSEPPVGFAPLMFDEYIASTMGHYTVGTGWPLCISTNAPAEDIDTLLKFLDLNADPAFLYELTNGPKGLFWDEKEDGTTYLTEAGKEYATTGTYVLESGEEYKYWNGRYTLKGSLLTTEGGIDPTHKNELKTLTSSNNLLKAWSEFYGGEYEFPIDKLEAEDRIALRPLSLVSFMPVLDDDQKLIRDAVGAVLQQNGWKMVYAADEAEFNALWEQTKADALGLGAQEIIDWAIEQIGVANETAKKYE